MSATAFRRSIYAWSHVGHRAENEDRFVVLDSSADDSGLFVVADGFGGHAGGSMAADALIDVAKRAWSERVLAFEPETFLRRLVRRAHCEVRRVGDVGNQDPRSTLAALILKDGRATSIHAGDSRIMQFSASSMVGRTLDHSLAQLKLSDGTISEEHLATHADQARLYRCIGGPESHKGEVNHWDVSKGGRFVVCTDGFWQVFTPDETLEVFRSNDPTREMERRLRQKLKQLHHHDNTTVILIEMEQNQKC